jgi:hypothetical protein
VAAGYPSHAGAYLLQVTAVEQGGSYTGVYAQLNFTVNASATASLSANLSSPQPAGTAITLTAAATGIATPTYQFAVDQLNGAGWTVLQTYGTSNTCTWSPSVAGPYVLQVTAREHGSTVPYAAYAQLGYTVTAKAASSR